MSVRVNVRMSKFTRTLIKFGVSTPIVETWITVRPLSIESTLFLFFLIYNFLDTSYKSYQKTRGFIASDTPFLYES